MDVVTAFLQGDLEEEIFMDQPEFFNDGSTMVCRLNKAVYGLKQDGRPWNRKLDSFPISIGFNKSRADPCVYVKQGLIIAIYVDDFLIFYTDDHILNELRHKLYQKFQMKDVGEARNCLGMRIIRGNDFIEIGQIHYVYVLLQKFGITGC